jgi:hypothetical protein
MTKLSEMWRRITATRYTRALEAEVARLRAENRALLNSILGIAGVPPITVAAPPAFPPTDTSGHAFKRAENAGTADAALAAEGPGAARATSSAPTSTEPARGMRRPRHMRVKLPTDAAAPMRRRSWHQIYRMLELDAAKKGSSKESSQSAKGSSQSTVHS